jgi:hypothetical protein
MLDFITNSNKDSDAVLKKVLFDRPVSSLARPQIAMLVGKYCDLRNINTIYEILIAIGFMPIIIADNDFKLTGLPADIFMMSKDKKSYANSDEIIMTINNCSTVLVLTGGEINSCLDILLSKLALSYKGVLASDNIAMFGQPWATDHKIVYGPTKKLIESLGYKLSKETGLKLKAEYLGNIAELTGALVVAVDDRQALVVDPNQKDSVGVINCADNIKLSDFSAIAVGLIAEKISGAISNPVDYVLAAGNLYRNYYSKEGAKGLKLFLNSQF